MRKNLLFLCCALFIMNLSSCRSYRDQNDQTISQINDSEPEQLVVYTTGIPHSFSFEQEGETQSYTLYPSKYMIGNRLVGGEIDYPNGNIFAKALQDFTDETGIAIELHFLEEYTGPNDPLQELLDQGKALPDLLLVGKYSRYDYPRLAEQGILLDFTEYTQADASFQNIDQYYQRVLSGGQIEKKQYGLPILFNLSGMITTKSYLNQLGIAELDAQLSYEGFLNLLVESCIWCESSENMNAICIHSGDTLNGLFIPRVLMAAAQPAYWDEQINQSLITEKEITDIYAVVQAYYRQLFTGIPLWQEQSWEENIQDSRSKGIGMLNKEEAENIGLFLSGGRSGGGNYHNSLLTDAAYFSSYYQDNGEEMVLYGIPTREDPHAYIANISTVCFGFQSTEHPQAVYRLARYLMDYQYPPFYGFSTNKSNTAEQLQQIQNTTITIYPDTMWSSITGGFSTMEEVEGQMETVQPLGEEYVSLIEDMLNHISGAGLPYSPLEYTINQRALYLLQTQQLTVEEVADWIIGKLEEHRLKQGELDPFYDRDYEASFRLDS